LLESNGNVCEDRTYFFFSSDKPEPGDQVEVRGEYEVEEISGYSFEIAATLADDFCSGKNGK